MKIVFYLKMINQKIKYRKMKKGKNSRVGLDVKINRPQNVYIGDNTYVNGGMLFTSENSKIKIGNNCLLSYNICLRTYSHNYIDKKVLINKQGEFEKNIIIEDDVWVGYGAQIMPGVTLHKGCVIGAGAIVTKDIDEYAVAVGCPARIIKYRK